MLRRQRERECERERERERDDDLLSKIALRRRNRTNEHVSFA